MRNSIIKATDVGPVMEMDAIFVSMVFHVRSSCPMSPVLPSPARRTHAIADGFRYESLSAVQAFTTRFRPMALRRRFIWKFRRWLPPVARTVSQGAFAPQFSPKPARLVAIRPGAHAAAPGGLEKITRTHCEHSEVGKGQYLWNNRRASMNPIGNGACTHTRRDVQVSGPRLDGWHDYDKAPTRNAIPAA